MGTPKPTQHHPHKIVDVNHNKTVSQNSTAQGKSHVFKQNKSININHLSQNIQLQKHTSKLTCYFNPNVAPFAEGCASVCKSPHLPQQLLLHAALQHQTKLIQVKTSAHQSSPKKEPKLNTRPTRKSSTSLEDQWASLL